MIGRLFFIILSQQKRKQLENKKITDRLIHFVNAVAGGMDQGKAYLQYYTHNKGILLNSAKSKASLLLAKSYIKELLKNAKETRTVAIAEAVKEGIRTVAKEFSAIMLTVEEMDAFHSAVIQGQLEMIENVTVYTWTDFMDDKGRVIRRERTAGIMKATRPPNIKEKQASIDALYRRKRAYPAYIPFGGEAIAGGGDIKIVNVVMLADGSKVPLFQNPGK